MIDMIETQTIRQVADQAGRVDELELREVPNTIGASYAQASGQTISNNTNTRVNFGGQIDDPDSHVTNPSTTWLFTCKVAGRYQVNARVEFGGSTAWGLGEVAILEVYKNGSPFRALHRRDDMNSSATSQAMDLHGSTVVRLDVGDTVYINLYQNSGSSLALASSAARNYVDIYRIT